MSCPVRPCRQVESAAAAGSGRYARSQLWTVCLPSASNGSWHGAAENPSAVSAVSAMTCAISAASVHGARGRASCKRQASGSNPLTGSQVRPGSALLAPGSTSVGCITLTPSITSGSARRTGRPKRLRCTGQPRSEWKITPAAGSRSVTALPVCPAAEDMQVRTSGTNRVRQAARAGCRGTPARLGRYRSPGCSTSTCQPAGSDVSTRKTNLGYIRWTIKPAFGSTQVRKVRGRWQNTLEPWVLSAHHIVRALRMGLAKA